jgi:chemotaxis protein CheX
MMDAEFITPFISSVQNVFSTMLQTEVTVQPPQRKAGGEPLFDVSGIIGMSGDVTGAVGLCFPMDTAERVVSLFIGAEVNANSEDFTDAVGELVNMITGNAKAGLNGKRVSISCPSVIVGKQHVVAQSSDGVTIQVPCDCDCGTFVVEVMVKIDPQDAAAEPQAAEASQ